MMHNLLSCFERPERLNNLELPGARHKSSRYAAIRPGANSPGSSKTRLMRM